MVIYPGKHIIAVSKVQSLSKNSCSGITHSDVSRMTARCTQNVVMSCSIIEYLDTRRQFECCWVSNEDHQRNSLGNIIPILVLLDVFMIIQLIVSISFTAKIGSNLIKQGWIKTLAISRANFLRVPMLFVCFRTYILLLWEKAPLMLKCCSISPH